MPTPQDYFLNCRSFVFRGARPKRAAHRPETAKKEARRTDGAGRADFGRPATSEVAQKPGWRVPLAAGRPPHRSIATWLDALGRN